MIDPLHRLASVYRGPTGTNESLPGARTTRRTKPEDKRMVIAARFKGTCRVCGGSIARGESIEWAKGDGAAHVKCAGVVESSSATPKPPNGPCWECKAPGRFRNFGAAAPVLCDGCAEKARRKRQGLCPTCGGIMPRGYAAKGYQCDGCADAEEGVGFGGAW